MIDDVVRHWTQVQWAWLIFWATFIFWVAYEFITFCEWEEDDDDEEEV
jgi:hypothetical protein